MFRHAKAERVEKEPLALEAARDTSIKSTQTKLPFKIASAITSPSSALEAATAAVSDAAAADSVRTRDYDDDCSESLSIDDLTPSAQTRSSTSNQTTIIPALCSSIDTLYCAGVLLVLSLWGRWKRQGRPHWWGQTLSLRLSITLNSCLG